MCFVFWSFLPPPSAVVMSTSPPKIASDFFRKTDKPIIRRIKNQWTITIWYRGTPSGKKQRKESGGYASKEAAEAEALMFRVALEVDGARHHWKKTYTDSSPPQHAKYIEIRDSLLPLLRNDEDSNKSITSSSITVTPPPSTSTNFNCNKRPLNAAEKSQMKRLKKEWGPCNVTKQLFIEQVLHLDSASQHFS